MSDALLPIPQEWKQLFTPFVRCFTKPQFNNFCQSATAMATSHHSSINRWAVLAGKHQSTLNDFFTVSPWDDATVRDKLSFVTRRRINDAFIGIIDDTLGHHPYSEHIENVGFYYDGLTKTEQKGHSIVTHGLHSAESGFVPFDLELYKKDGRSKNDIACAMIARTQHFKKLSLYILDSWYSNQQVLNTIQKYNSHFITEIKSNRNVTIGKKCRYAREHEKHISPKDWAKVDIKEGLYRYFQTSAFISCIGNVNFVFSQKYDKEEEEWSETYYLITDIISLRGERIIELFLLRGGIEGFHREAKQQLGLEHSTLRNTRGIERYLFLVLLVFVFLLLLNKQQMRDSLERKSIGQMREHLKASCFTMMFQKARSLDTKSIEAASKLLAYAI